MKSNKKKSNVGDNISAKDTNWSFDGNTVFKFDQHIQKSIPYYLAAHEIGLKVSDFFLRDKTAEYAVKIFNTHTTGQGLHIRGGSANGQYALLVENYAAANLFEVNGDGEVELTLKKKGFGEFYLKLEWARGGMSTVQLYGNCTDEEVYTYQTWRGHNKPESHNDAHLGNWFLKAIRRDWVEDNRPPIGHIKIGSEIVFSGNPSGGGQRTRAKVIGRGGSWGRKYFKVKLLEERGVKKIKPIGTIVEVHYDCIFSVKGK